MSYSFPLKKILKYFSFFFLALFFAIGGCAADLWWHLKKEWVDITPLIHVMGRQKFPLFKGLFTCETGQVFLSFREVTERGLEGKTSSQENGFWQFPKALSVDLHDVSLSHQEGGKTLKDITLGKIALSVKLRPLLKGEFSPITLHLSESTVRLRYFKKAGLGFENYPFSKIFGGQEAQNQADTLPLEKILADFKEISLEKTHLSLMKDGTKKERLLLELTKAHFSRSLSSARSLLWEGWHGSLEGKSFLEVQKPEIMSFALREDISSPLSPSENVKTRPQWHIEIQNFRPNQWEDFLQVPTLSLLKFPVSLQAEGEITPDKSPFFPHIAAKIILGEGYFSPSLRAQELHLKGAEISATLLKSEKSIAINLSIPALRLEDSLGKEVHLSVKTEMELNSLLSPKHVELRLETLLPSFDFASLASIWPQGAMKGARRWMTQNMTQGEGKNLHIEMRLASETGIGDLDVKELKGDLYGEHLSVTWLKPIQPVTDLWAHAFFVTADILQIDLAHGHLSDMKGKEIAIPSGKVTITGMMKEDQYGDIRLLMDGDLASYLHILNHPRLHLLSRLPLKLGNPSGFLRTELGITLPFDSRVTMAEIGFDIDAYYRNLAVDTAWIGTVRHCTGSLNFDGENLKMQGKAVLHDVPMEIALEDRFSFPMQRHALIKAWVNNSELRKLGVGIPLKTFTGSVRLEADLHQEQATDRHISGDISVLLDLQDIGLKTKFWRKKQAEEAFLKAHLALEGNHITSLDQIFADGPDLSVRATSFMRHGEVSGLDISSYQLGKNKGKMNFQWPVQGDIEKKYHIDIKADFLDLTPLFPSSHKEKKKEPPKQEKKKEASRESYPLSLPQGTWDIMMSSDKILYQKQKFIGHFKMSASWKAHQIESFSASFQQPTFLMMSLQRDPIQEKRHLFKFYLEDLSLLSRDLLDYHHLKGGAIKLDGVFSSQNPQDSAGWGLGLAPFHGSLSLKKLDIVHPPPILTAATLFAPLHWGEIRRDRFENIQLLLNLSVENQKIEMSDGQVGNAILGGTFTGGVDMAHQNMSLTGTISPFFQINAAPGYIPKIGSYFAPEKGSGMMAMTYSVNGTLSDPKISVNPFAFFLPGMLREIIH